MYSYRKLIFFISIICIVINPVCSQSAWMEWKGADSDEKSEVRWEDQYQHLEELAEHPFNINTITKEQLEQLPFLNLFPHLSIMPFSIM